MARWAWDCLSGLQVGKYAEYFVKMEFTMYGGEVYTTEVDEHGIDFIARPAGGDFHEVQVKSVRGCNYVFFPKHKFAPRDRLLAAVVLFWEGKEPSLYLIPSRAWERADGVLLCGRDYDGLRSQPEWGINLSVRNLSMLDPYRFDTIVASLAS